jgi:hypothetical protein
MVAHVSFQGIVIGENSLAVAVNRVKFVVPFEGETQSYPTIGKLFKASINRSTLGTKLIFTIDISSTP